MYEIHERLYVGDEHDCFHEDRDGWSVVHACKSPCHQAAVGYRGSLPSHHPHYLQYRHAQHLYLNLIDPPKPLFKLESFYSFLSFASEALGSGQQFLIHCNKGESRAPSLGLIVLAKYLKVIPGDSYANARDEFERIFPGYNPGLGIQGFLEDRWSEI